MKVRGISAFQRVFFCSGEEETSALVTKFDFLGTSFRPLTPNREWFPPFMPELMARTVRRRDDG